MPTLSETELSHTVTATATPELPHAAITIPMPELAQVNPVNQIDRNYSILRELYQIGSRHSNDPYEGLTIQLQDGLRVLVDHWQMAMGFIVEANQTQILLESYALLAGDKHLAQQTPAEQNLTQAGSEEPQTIFGQLAQQAARIDILDASTQNSYTAQYLLPSTLISKPNMSPPASLNQSVNPWDQIFARAQCYLGIPIVVHDRPFGMVGFVGLAPRKDSFTPYELELLALFGNWAGSVLERMQSRSLRATEQSDLARINQEFARSNSDLDHFVYIASHDLKEPLRGISQYSQFLVEDYHEQLDDEGKRMLGALVEQSQRMGKQIDDLRFYSRIGRQESGIDVVDLNDVVADVRASLHTLLDETSVGIRIPRSLPSIEGNAALITTVFQNLIANAARYNDKAHKWIQISWSYQLPDGEEIGMIEADDEAIPDDELAAMIRQLHRDDGRIVITIADNGIGIRERDQEAIFTMFRRLHNQDEFGGGTGAGLSIVKRIIEQQGGKLWLESQPGIGSQFHFTFG